MLHPAQDQLSHFFALSLDLFCVAGADGYFKVLNSAWVDTLGYSKEELLSRPYIDFVHPEDKTATAHQQQRIKDGLLVIDFQNRYRHQDGSWRWLSWKATPQPDGTIYAVARDITQQKEDERATQVLLRNLEASNKELDQFAFVVSHDLKSPLRSISHLVEWIREDLEGHPNAEAEEHLNLLANKAVRMQRLIEDLLHYARSGRRDMPFERVPLAPILAEILEALSKPDDYEIVVLGELRPIWGVQSDLYLVFQNLIGNAIKYRSPGPGRLTIQQTLQGDMWVIAFQDNGIGIDAKHHERVFQVFQRLQTDEQVEGTGIGLALVKKIVDGAGGTILLASAPGRGSTFTIYWPDRPKLA